MSRDADSQKTAPGEPIRLAHLRRVGPALIVIVASLVLVYLVPDLEFARPWTPEEPVPFWNLVGRPFEADEEREDEERHEKVEEFAREALAEKEPVPRDRPERPVIEIEDGDGPPPYEPQPGDEEPASRSIELFEGDELDPFFAQLALTDAGVADEMTRVIHWGDSVIGVDGIPGAIRRRMQARFGDGGHGLHLIEPPNTSYRHNEVDFEHNGNWRLCFIIQKCKKDGRYGLGGATVWSAGGGQSSFAPNPRHSSGKVARFEVGYMAQPRGGRLKVAVDDREPVFIDTEAEQVEDRWYGVELDEGMHELTLRASGGGRVRLYGVTMEREPPGVVWDSAALVGAFTKRLGEFDEAHLRAQLGHRQTNLAVLMFGGNDMIRSTLTGEEYEQEYREVLQLLRRAAPDLPCLVMSPLDHGERKGVRIVSRPIVPVLVEAQRRAARAEGCAFFDSYMAMGGEGSAGRWYKHSPRLMGGDLGHATHRGHVVIGEMFHRALVEAYVAYRKREG